MIRRPLLFITAFLAVFLLFFCAGSALAIPPLPQCSNNVDDDGDGKLDYPADPDCTAPSDLGEAGVTVRACSNGANSGDVADGDTLADYPADHGCTSASDNSEDNPGTAPACADGQDSDGDGRVDLADPGCVAASDPSEQDTACSNNVDDDGDGKQDWPGDLGCTAPAATINGPDQIDNNEMDASACNDGRDNDGDGKIDADAGALHDPGCASLADGDETDPAAGPAPSPGPAPVPSRPGAPGSPPMIGPGAPSPIIGPDGVAVPPNLLGQSGHTHNGSGDASDGRIVGLRKTARIRPGGKTKLRGRLLDPAGNPIVGAALSVTSTRESYIIHSGKTGRFAKTLRWDQSRIVVVAWYPWGDSPTAVSQRVRVLGMAKVTLHVKVARGAFRFSGSVLGAPRRSRVAVQVRQRGRWVSAWDGGVNAQQRFRGRRPYSARGWTYCFRSRWSAQPGSVYAAGFSRKVCRRG